PRPGGTREATAVAGAAWAAGARRREARGLRSPWASPRRGRAAGARGAPLRPPPGRDDEDAEQRRRPDDGPHRAVAVGGREERVQQVDPRAGQQRAEERAGPAAHVEEARPRAVLAVRHDAHED